MSHGSVRYGSHRLEQEVRELHIQVNHSRSWLQVLDEDSSQYSESLVVQSLPPGRVITRETVNIDVETDSRAMCNSHGSTALYELTLLERRLLLYILSEEMAGLVSPRKASLSSNCWTGRYSVFFLDPILTL